MGRMQFDSGGRLIGVDKKIFDFSEKHLDEENNSDLKTSESLEFLKEEKFENIFANPYWSLHEDKKELKPLAFSNGKSQEDIVRETVELIKEGRKIILLHGVCGTGKSAIALNIARALG